MGYTTDFDGEFEFDKPLTLEQMRVLKAFVEKRHESNDRNDMSTGDKTPGYYCQWVPTEDGTGLHWDGGEKFYDYVEWLEYLVTHFFKPWGVRLNGEVTWQGEDPNDLGKIVVTNNAVDTKQGRVVYD